MLTSHPPEVTDSFPLYIKASCLLGKVKTFNVRFKQRYSASQNVSGAEPTEARDTTEFQMLDNLLKNFISNIPREFRDPLRADRRVDPILYTALLIPHV